MDHALLINECLNTPLQSKQKHTQWPWNHGCCNATTAATTIEGLSYHEIPCRLHNLFPRCSYCQKTGFSQC